MNQIDLIFQLEQIKAFAETSKLKRFFNNPFRYVVSIIYSRVLPKLVEFNYRTVVKTFWGQNMHILLPASIDIYLSGGKTHDSEIRLAKLLVNELKNDSCFLDIGAHYGYFTMLASHLLNEGKVYSIEPSSESFQVLSSNCKDLSNVVLFHCALTESDGKIEFYEFPTYYSEYNSFEIDHYFKEKWYDKNKVHKRIIEGKKGDTLIESFGLPPSIIKIDVEGAENSVLMGLQSFLSHNYPTIIMEFAASYKGNVKHKTAHQFLLDLHYKPLSIDNKGGLTCIEYDIDVYLNNLGLESDNIVYKKYFS